MKPKKTKIGKYEFFEEFEVIKNILDKTEREKLKTLDIWCWNWRIKAIFEKLYKWDFIYYWIDKELFKDQVCDVFFHWDILDILEKIKGKKNFDIIIANWIFENNLDFTLENLNKVFDLMLNNWFFYANLWNFWEEIYKNSKIENIEKYVESKLVPIIKQSKFSDKFDIFYFEKQKNSWFNISIILKKNL